MWSAHIRHTQKDKTSSDKTGGGGFSVSHWWMFRCVAVSQAAGWLVVETSAIVCWLHCLPAEPAQGSNGLAVSAVLYPYQVASPPTMVH